MLRRTYLCSLLPYNIYFSGLAGWLSSIKREMRENIIIKWLHVDCYHIISLLGCQIILFFEPPSWTYLKYININTFTGRTLLANTLYCYNLFIYNYLLIYTYWVLNTLLNIIIYLHILTTLIDIYISYYSLTYNLYYTYTYYTIPY
jgi:hypothetical protein